MNLFQVLRKEGFVLPGSGKRKTQKGSREEKTWELGFWVCIGVHQRWQETTIGGKNEKRGEKNTFKGIDQNSLLYRKFRITWKVKRRDSIDLVVRFSHLSFEASVWLEMMLQRPPRTDLAVLLSFHVFTLNHHHSFLNNFSNFLKVLSKILQRSICWTRTQPFLSDHFSHSGPRKCEHLK